MPDELEVMRLKNVIARLSELADALDDEMSVEPNTERAAMQYEAARRIRQSLKEAVREAESSMSIYYSPSVYGARTVGSVDTIGGYEYNMFLVVQRQSDNELFWATDAGCSCFAPFEYVSSIEDMELITDTATFSKIARKWIRESGGSPFHRDNMESLVVRTRQLYKSAQKGAK